MKFYRIAVNKNSELYSHFEPCGTDLQYAEKEFNKICAECQYCEDTVELQSDVEGIFNEDLTPGDHLVVTSNTGNWLTIKSK
jgi:DNA-binding MurR/RpiR family transcriptional regulator